ncbi:MAG TPA: LLM class flavin-dependent oxidoreductase, partial [Gemmataceae bacterium]|nr:LLM class flavin-dependent oxidoreductase [Gemmataceae bacterium]
APDYLHEALALYRRYFEPSGRLAEPRVMVAANVFAADTDDEARRLFTSAQQQFLNLVRGTPGLLPPPVESMDELWLPHERRHVDRMTRCSAVGSPDAVRRWLERFAAETRADEMILAGQIYDHAARLRSFEVAAAVHATPVPAAAGV